MKQFYFTCKLIVLSILVLFQQDIRGENRLAVVRIPSHGISGTVIYTDSGKSLILSCAHGFENESRFTKIVVDVPYSSTQSHKIIKTGANVLRKVDYKNDLSLIEVGAGPLPFVCKVAPIGYKIPNMNALSVGYDNMTKLQNGPLTKLATIIGSSSNVTYTREIPWHGRSGGALISNNGKDYLIGVVQGYEVRPFSRGMYISHNRILEFLSTDNKTNPYLLPQQRQINPYLDFTTPQKKSTPLCPT